MSGDSYLDLPEVIHRVKLSKATIYRKMNAKEFPEQIHVSENRVCWLESEIAAWVEERKNCARAHGGTRWTPPVGHAATQS